MASCNILKLGMSGGMLPPGKLLHLRLLLVVSETTIKKNYKHYFDTWKFSAGEGGSLVPHPLNQFLLSILVRLSILKALANACRNIINSIMS